MSAALLEEVIFMKSHRILKLKMGEGIAHLHQDLHRIMFMVSRLFLTMDEMYMQIMQRFRFWGAQQNISNLTHTLR